MDNRNARIICIIGFGLMMFSLGACLKGTLLGQRFEARVWLFPLVMCVLGFYGAIKKEN